jgi:hypothetical protein
LPGSKGVEGKGGKGGSWEKGGEMTQTLYAHMNKRKREENLANNTYCMNSIKKKVGQPMGHPLPIQFKTLHIGLQPTFPVLTLVDPTL